MLPFAALPASARPDASTAPATVAGDCKQGSDCVVVLTETSPGNWASAADEPEQQIAVGDVQNVQGYTCGGNCAALNPDGTYANVQQNPFIGSGSSLDQVLVQAGIDPNAIDHVTLDGSGKSTPTLTAAEISASSGLYYLNGVPTIYTNGAQGLAFYRPLKSDDGDPNAVDPSDANGGDAIFPSDEIDIYVWDTPQLQVTATATPDDSTTGTTVRLAASTVGEPTSADPISYNWDFGDGSGSEAGQSVTHAFTTAGTYIATVTATGADGSGGTAAVAVTAVAPTATKPPSGQHHRHGGNGNGGGHNRNGSGHSPKHHAPSTGPVTGGGHHGGAQPGPHVPGLDSGQRSGQASGDHPRRSNHAAKPGQPSGSSRVGRFTTELSPPGGAKTSPAAPAGHGGQVRHVAGSTHAADQPLVSGQSLGDGEHLRLVALGTTVAPSGSAPAEAAAAAGLTDWRLWFGIGVVLCLVAGGAGREWRSRRP